MEAPQGSLLERSGRLDSAVIERDRELAEEVLAPDFALVLVHPAPATVPRDRWLAMLPSYVVHDWHTEEQVVEERGEVGTVLQRVRMRATVLGEDRSGLFVLSDLWVRVDGSWRVWRRHSSPLSAGAMPGG